LVLLDASVDARHQNSAVFAQRVTKGDLSDISSPTRRMDRWAESDGAGSLTGRAIGAPMFPCASLRRR
jgi:hypothetical protein